MEQEKKRKGADPRSFRESSIGLGYRVPMVIASPWSRGGYVNSQVFDHTSSLQFLEKFLEHKTGKKIEESNISSWRRAVCGDLSSVFRPYHGEKLVSPDALNRELFIESIHKAKFKNPPADFKKLSAEEIAAANKEPHTASFMPAQEKGIRPANALPYEMYADGTLNRNEQRFEIFFESKNNSFGKNTAGVPFLVYAIDENDVTVRSYAVTAADSISDAWDISAFTNGQYHLELHAPNGFFRSFKGNSNDPALVTACRYQLDKNKKTPTGNIELALKNNAPENCELEINNHYTKKTTTRLLAANTSFILVPDLQQNHGWYDISVRIKGNASFEKRYAGKVETGKEGFTDPMMGRTI
jgi:phospholipase C